RAVLCCTNMLLLHEKSINRTSLAESARFRAVFAHFLLVISEFAQRDAKHTVGNTREGILRVLACWKKACTASGCRLGILQNCCQLGILTSSRYRNDKDSEENG
ncbi:hypothetical protein PENTCL1PPCAC_4158, partial [Pristionchus entomophagus]